MDNNNLVQKSTNQLGQKWQLFLLTSGLVYLLFILLQQLKNASLYSKQTYFLIVATTQKEITNQK
jgi:hypothetical protein